MNKQSSARIVSSSAVSALALSVFSVGALHMQSAYAASPAFEEIVVTAQKREQSVFDVAASVSAIPMQSLERSGLVLLADWAPTVPGISIFARGASGFNQVIMRGITSGNQQVSPTVGFYVDETPFGGSSPLSGTNSIFQPDFDSLDVDRIEVLRGPQGTLYGASTLGGLIKFVTKKPDPSVFEGNARLELRSVKKGDMGYTIRAGINAPLVKDKAAVRISGFNRMDPGYIDNVTTGKKDSNDATVYGGRISLGVYPSEELSIRLTAAYQKIDTDSALTMELDPTTLAPVYGDLRKSRNIEDYFSVDYRLLDATVEWDAGPFTVLSSTSYSEVNVDLGLDLTVTLGGLPNTLSGGATGPAIVTVFQDPGHRKFTEELRLTSPTGERFEWMGGVFFTEEKVGLTSNIPAVSATTGDPLDAPYDLLLSSRYFGKYKEYAVFGNVTYNVTDDLGITFGVRWSRNNQNSDIFSAGPIGTNRLDLGKSSESVWTFLAAVNWRVDETVSLFARAASGYRPGGPIEPVPAAILQGIEIPSQFDSDSVWSYEAGVKGIWLEGMLSATLSAFYIDWKDVQLPRLIQGFRVLENGDGARSQGGEAEITVRPIEGLKLGFRGAYTDAQLTSTNLVIGAVEGDPLPFVSKWSLSGSIDYEFPLGDSMTGNVGATWLHRSGVYTTVSMDAGNPRRYLDGFDTVDLRAGISWERVAISLYARNIFDKRAYTAGAFSGAVFRAVPIQPQTIGLAISTNF